MIPIEVTEHPMTELREYAKVSIAFDVTRVLAIDLRDRGLGGLHFSEVELDAPYHKDYDALEHPTEWPRRFDVSNWCARVARIDGICVGGIVIAYDTPGVDMLEGRRDLAVIWDLRVAPSARRRGVGRTLFAAAEAWAAARGARTLKVETQNINVGACRFYARQGCTLGEVSRFAYPAHPGEARLLWYKSLEAVEDRDRHTLV